MGLVARHVVKGFWTPPNLHVGDVWHKGGSALLVVGLVENPENLLDSFALVAPGQLSSPDQVTVLFDATPSAIAAFAFPQGATPVAPQTSGGISPEIIVFLFAIVGLTFIGLVAVAGFTVVAQRRLRALGMLSSLGATDRHVRTVMVANGAVVGAVGALIGAVIGLGAWIAYAPRLSTSAHHRVVWTNLPWWLIGTSMVLAIGTAVLASRRPARAVAQLSVVAALSGRPAPPKPLHRSAIPGALLLVIGLVLLAFSGGWGANGAKETLMLFTGMVAVAIGLLLLAPLAIAVLAVNSGRAPIGVRIALRDLARYRARSGAALAAASFAVLIAMFISLIATGRYADPLDYFGPNLPANQLVVYAPGYGPGGGIPGPADSGAQQSPTQLQARASAIAASLGSHDVLALASSGAELGKATLRGVTSNSGSLYVATPELLRYYGIAASAIDPTAIVITSRSGLEGTADLRLLYGFPVAGPPSFQSLKDPKVQTITSLPTDTSQPNLLVTTYAVDKLGLQVTPAGWLIQTPRALNSGQINNARQAAQAAGMTIETKSDNPSLAQLRNYATAAGILLALGVLAMTAGLIRSETAGDLRILTAAGASSRTRRTVTGATVGALGLLGALLGTAVAYVATATFFRSQLSQRMSHVPVLDLLVTLVGLPVAAAAGGWLFAGREPAAIAHQPLE